MTIQVKVLEQYSPPDCYAMPTDSASFRWLFLGNEVAGGSNFGVKSVNSTPKVQPYI